MRGPLIALLGLLVAATLQGVVGDQPSEYECRPYIEKALKENQASLPASSPEDAGSIEQDADDLELMQDDAREQDDPAASDGTEEASVEETGQAEGEVGPEDADISGETEESSEDGGSSAEEGVASVGDSTEEEALNDEGHVSAEEDASKSDGEVEGSSEEASTEGGEASLEEGSTNDIASPEEGTAEAGEESVEEGVVEGGEESLGSEESNAEGAPAEDSKEEGAATDESLEEGTAGGESLEDGTTEGETSSEVGTSVGGASSEEETAEGESLESTAEGGASLEEGATDGESLEENAEEGNLEGTTKGESIEDGTTEDASLESTTEGGESSEEGASDGESLEESTVKEGDVSSEENATEGEESLEDGAADGGSSLEEEAVGGEASAEDETTEEGESLEGTTGEASLEEGTTEASADSTEGSESSSEEDVADGVEGSIEEATQEASLEETLSSVEKVNIEESSSEEAAGKEESDGSVEEEVISRKPRSVDDEAEGGEASTETEALVEEEVSQMEATALVEETPEEELSYEVEIPANLRPREHIAQILRLDEESVEDDVLVGRAVESTLKDLKRFYDNAIKPLEILYKYRDLSNRHFGDPEIFSKPLILFMGPWSGGKSSIINYLLDNEYKRSSLRTGAEPSPAYFNILMWGDREEVLDGTQLAADWTFSGLQKFGQGLLDRLRGLRLNNRLLEKVNIVEIPGILEIRKQVERVFPFNDACQWFIDRADIIFLVYDPAKLDVGPETEAILDQLKGREYQTRIVLNKADQVRPEELMRVQGTLIWNISPLMSSTQPPVMYSTSLWSMPYEVGAPLRLLRAQERAFLKDMREAVDKRVENKIASARRFAVRVRNHAKMVDCYLTTYYNHKSFFGNRKRISDDIIEKPQDYHIYEGLSTLTNISRYDLPDPETYRDFFRVNPLYEFQQLAATCTYFKGCPINRLDVAIAYELPELVGKYKKAVETALTKPPST